MRSKSDLTPGLVLVPSATEFLREIESALGYRASIRATVVLATISRVATTSTHAFSSPPIAESPSTSKSSSTVPT